MAMETNGYPQTESLFEPLTQLSREHLAAMADAAVADHNSFDIAPTSPSQKRKRGAVDSSPDTRRSKHRVPTATMSSTPDAAYVETAVEAAQAAAQAATHADFAALQQATVERHESSDPANASSTAAAALGTLYPNMHVPQSHDETFVAPSAAGSEHQSQPSYGQDEMIQPDGLPSTSPNSVQHQPPHNGVRSGSSSYANNDAVKPAVGSEEWHKLRKNNHKEVERRRRETINEGINELAKIVPGNEKAKGVILSNAVAYITQLKDNDAANLEKWTLEKLLTEQAIQELSASNERLKQECERVFHEMIAWKKLAQDAGLELTQAKTEVPSSS